MTKSLNITEKMVLGTAQFGMDYGITNIRGKPSKKEIFGIINLAWEKGVRRFDTAPVYGRSEELLGEFIAANGLQNEAIVLTKIPSLEELSDYRKFILLNLETSLNHLGCPIDVLFFHNPANSVLLMRDSDFFENLLHDYPISNLGVSVYEPQEVDNLSNSHCELAFQFPFNVLDRRFEQVIMPKGKRYARSVFLQGLLVSENGLRPDAPEELLNLHKEYQRKLAAHDVSPVDFAVSYVARSEVVDYFLVGVESKQQLMYILNGESDISQDSIFLEPLLSNISEKWLDLREWK